MPERARIALCVEDDEMNRDLIGAVFAKYLPEVALHHASNGREALDTAPDPLDLVVIDGQLGDMHGADVARELRRTRPDLRILVVSGSTPDRAWPTDGPVHFLGKPYTLRALADAVTALLDR